MAEALQCLLCTTLQQAMGNEKTQGRVTRREQTCTDTFLGVLRTLPEAPDISGLWTSWATFCVFLLNSSWWIQRPAEEITEEKSLATWFYTFLLIYMMTPIFLPLDKLLFYLWSFIQISCFLIHFYRRIIFIWIWKLQIKTRPGLISSWKACCCSNIPNHLPSSSPYFSYYNDLLSLTVKDFIFVSWGS